MNWLDALVNLVVWIFAAVGSIGLIACVLLFLVFHQGVRDFQDYESEP